MKQNRLTFFSSTNLTLPINIYTTLAEDCFNFGHIKNNSANISGLLNHLIPNLSAYRQDLHNQLLAYNNYDEELTLKIEESIHNVYFNKYDFCEDGTINVPFRVNKSHYKDFLIIHDVELNKYNTDFTNYVRSLLIEYCSKKPTQREYYHFYKEVNIIKFAITNNYLCHFHLKDQVVSMVPITIESDYPATGNLVGGITEDKQSAWVVVLSELKHVIVDEDISITITEEDCAFIYDFLEEYNKKED